MFPDSLAYEWSKLKNLRKIQSVHELADSRAQLSYLPFHWDETFYNSSLDRNLKVNQVLTTMVLEIFIYLDRATSKTWSKTPDPDLQKNLDLENTGPSKILILKNIA